MQLKKQSREMTLFSNNGGTTSFNDEYDDEDDDENDNLSNDDELEEEEEEEGDDSDDEEVSDQEDQESEVEEENYEDVGYDDEEVEVEVEVEVEKKLSSRSMGRNNKEALKSLSLSDGHQPRRDFMKSVYGPDWASKDQRTLPGGKGFPRDDSDDDTDQIGGLFSTAPTTNNKAADDVHAVDSSRLSTTTFFSRGITTTTDSYPQNSVDDALSYLFINKEEKDDHTSSSLLNSLKLRFVTGGYLDSTIAATPSSAKSTGLEEEEEYGDFEDLQTGQVFTSNTRNGNNNNNNEEEEEDEEEGSDESESDDQLDEEEVEKRNMEIDQQLRLMNASKKAMFKSNFDANYDKDKTVALQNQLHKLFNYYLLPGWKTKREEETEG